MIETLAAAVAFVLADPRITESSGLATASSGDLVYTHNDSGDDGRIFAVGPDGRTRTAYVVPGVEPRDWEDIALGPDEQGRSSLWIGDIGDNHAVRDYGLLVHRVLEPEPTDQEEVTTESPTSFRLRYPEGPRDAETLLVHPRTGRMYVVTKPLTGAAQVYVAPERLDAAGPNQLEQVAEVTTQVTGTPGGPGIGALANSLVTAGDISPDGKHVALRTYTDVYEWRVPDDDVAAAFAGEPTVTPLPERQQGEGLTYTADGDAVLVSTEGADSAVDRVVLGRPEEPTAAPDEPFATAETDQRLPWGPLAAGGGVLVVLLLLARRAHG